MRYGLLGSIFSYLEHFALLSQSKKLFICLFHRFESYNLFDFYKTVFVFLLHYVLNVTFNNMY